jgi:hypothetical protein
LTAEVIEKEKCGLLTEKSVTLLLFLCIELLKAKREKDEQFNTLLSSLRTITKCDSKVAEAMAKQIIFGILKLVESNDYVTR